jgi:hypothetical protein
MHPKARADHLVIQELPDETLVFDQLTNKAHCLNRATALVWKHCDGKTDLAALSRLFEHQAQASVLVQLALEQISSRHLLETPVERGSPAQRRSRRELLKQLAAAAVTLPVILTVTAPRANAAGSHAAPPAQACLSVESPCTSNSQCCSGRCETTIFFACACSNTGTGCNSTSDCCFQFQGAKCVSGICQPPPP